MTERRGKRRKQLVDALKEKRGPGNCTRKHYIALCGEHALEEPTCRKTEYGMN